ncbi:MAG: hypothetical protein ACYDDC_00940 [Thermoplasmataceae archaeon]
MKKPKILPDWILSDALKLINDGNYDLYPCTRCVKLVIDFKWQFKKQNYGRCGWNSNTHCESYVKRTLLEALR